MSKRPDQMSKAEHPTQQLSGQVMPIQDRQPPPDISEVRRALSTLPAEIRSLARSSKKRAPGWDPEHRSVIVGPGCCLPPTKAAQTPKPRRG